MGNHTMALKQVLLVGGSGNGVHSTSRKVANALLKKLGAEPNITKDLAVNPPTFVDGNWVQARFNPDATDENKNAPSTTNSDVAVKEFLAADTIVLATPMYNFTVSASVKAWFDQIAVVGKTFKYGEGGNPEALSSGKKTVRGGGNWGGAVGHAVRLPDAVRQAFHGVPWDQRHHL